MDGDINSLIGSIGIIIGFVLVGAVMIAYVWVGPKLWTPRKEWFSRSLASGCLAGLAVFFLLTVTFLASSSNPVSLVFSPASAILLGVSVGTSVFAALGNFVRIRMWDEKDRFMRRVFEKLGKHSWKR